MIKSVFYLFLLSCSIEDDKVESIVYQIVNKSGHDIRLFVKPDSTKSAVDTLKISDGDSISKEHSRRAGAGHFGFYLWAQSQVKIKFSGSPTKCLVFKGKILNENGIVDSNDIRLEHPYKKNYDRYVVTNELYNRANICE